MTAVSENPVFEMNLGTIISLFHVCHDIQLYALPYIPACIYGLGTLALTERQEEKIQIAENNWVRRICKVTKEDRRKMKELREEIGMKKLLKMKVAGSRIRWAKNG